MTDPVVAEAFIIQGRKCFKIVQMVSMALLDLAFSLNWGGGGSCRDLGQDQSLFGYHKFAFGEGSRARGPLCSVVLAVAVFRGSRIPSMQLT